MGRATTQILRALGFGSETTQPDSVSRTQAKMATLAFDSNSPPMGAPSLRTDSIAAGDKRATPAADGLHSIWNFDGGDIALSAYPEAIGSRACWTVFGQVLTTEPPPTPLVVHVGEVMEVQVATSDTGEFVLRRVRGDDITLVLLLKSGNVTVGPLLTTESDTAANKTLSPDQIEASKY